MRLTKRLGDIVERGSGIDALAKQKHLCRILGVGAHKLVHPVIGHTPIKFCEKRHFRVQCVTCPARMLSAIIQGMVLKPLYLLCRIVNV